MFKRIKELEERLRIRSEEGIEPSSRHQHASSTRSNRGDGRSNRPTGADKYMDQIVGCEAFLLAAFQTADGPFLPVKIAAADAPFVNVLLSPKTPWRNRPKDIEYSEIVNLMRGETDAFEEMTPISRAPYAFVRTTAKRVNPFYHLLVYRGDSPAGN
jgi:hypothetical protein